MTRNQVILLVIILFAIVANCIIHYQSPAYKYYREQFAQSDENYKSFVDHVKREFVPAIYAAISNRTGLVSAKSDDKSVARTYHDLTASYFECGNDKGVYYRGFVYRVGDSFCGEPILDLSPTTLSTPSRDFLLQCPSNSLHLAR